MKAVRFFHVGWFPTRLSVELQPLLVWRLMKEFLLHMTRQRGWSFLMLSSKFLLLEFVMDFYFNPYVSLWVRSLLTVCIFLGYLNARVLRLQKGHKYCLLGRLSSEVGWNYYDTIKVSACHNVSFMFFWPIEVCYIALFDQFYTCLVRGWDFDADNTMLNLLEFVLFGPFFPYFFFFHNKLKIVLMTIPSLFD